MIQRFSNRQLLLAVTLFCAALFGAGLYLQHVVGLEPCPMCIVQRYALVAVAVTAAVAAWMGPRGQIGVLALLAGFAGFGAFVAARQSWLQWYPPQVASCGRDFYGMIEAFPLQRVIPMIFRGSGDCTKVDWTLLGGSIANWSFLCFIGIAVLATALLWRSRR